MEKFKIFEVSKDDILYLKKTFPNLNVTEEEIDGLEPIEIEQFARTVQEDLLGDYYYFLACIVEDYFGGLREEKKLVESGPDSP